MAIKNEEDLNGAIESHRKFMSSQYRSFLPSISKLTKIQQNLLESALENHNLEKGDVYCVVIAIRTGEIVSKDLCLYVKINNVHKNGSYNYTWYPVGQGFY